MNRSLSQMILVLLGTGFILVGQAASQDTAEDGVIRSYDGSLDLPDEIAFRQFLALIQPGREFPDSLNLRILSRALNINPDENGSFDGVLPYVELFERADAAMMEEIIVNSDAVLCVPNRASLTRKEIGNAMNQSEDIVDVAADRQYKIVKNALSGEQQEAFRAYLDKVKLGTGYVRNDHTMAERDIRVDLEQQCSHLNNEKLNRGIIQ